MAMNLFTKTYLAHTSDPSSSGPLPEFFVCEQNDRNAEAFLSDVRQKGGAELARRVRRAGTAKE